MVIGSYPPATVTAQVATYGGTDTTGHSISTNANSNITNATATVTTIATNTKWLVEITVDALYPVAVSGNCTVLINLVVDGAAAVATDGMRHTAMTASSFYIDRDKLTGRMVVTLATAASHTFLANIALTGSGGTLTVGCVTLTATQLAG